MTNLFVTKLRNGTKIAINIEHMENVYEDQAGLAVVVMLNQRSFEIEDTFDFFIRRLQ